MNNSRYLASLLSFFVLTSGTLLSQNQDSVKAYILEFIEPTPGIVLTYSTNSVSLEYEQVAPLTPATEEFIDKQKKAYEETNDPLILLSISQTYKRMNRHKESAEWAEKALLAIESQMMQYPDSIEIVENAFAIYLGNNKFDLACLTAEMVSDHYENSKSLLFEATAYLFSGKTDEGTAKANKGLLLYPDVAEWYMLKAMYEFYSKMQIFDFLSGEFSSDDIQIDASFLDEGLSNYPDNLRIELASSLGHFFLYSYEKVMIDFYKQTGPDTEIEGFEFDLGESVQQELNKYLHQLTELSKNKKLKDWHTIYYTLGMIELFRSNPDRAIRHFEKAIELLKPKYRNASDNAYHYYDNLIFCHRILGDVNSAEKALKRKATEDTNIGPVAAHYVEMARYRVMDGDLKSAQDLLDQAMGIDSTEITAFSTKALLSMLNNELDEALVLILAAESINADDLFNFKSMVLLQLLMKDTDKVTSLINHLERYDPSDTFVRDARSLLDTK